MAIVILDEEKTHDPSKDSGRPFRTQDELKTSILFDKEKPLNEITHFIRGMKWTVDYFLQIRDVNDTINKPDVNIPVGVQKYNRINKLEIILQSAINQETIDNIAGEAVINAGFMPNVDDVFLATLTGGRQGLFLITAVNKRNYNLHQTHNVEFKLFMFLETQPEVYNDIVNKTMKEYVYDKDHILDYSAPVLVASDYKAKINMKHVVPELLDYYLTNNINPSKLVLAPMTTSSVYTDTLLTEFLFKIVDVSDNYKSSKITRLDLRVKHGSILTIWDVLLKRDYSLLKLCRSNLGFASTSIMHHHGFNHTLACIGVHYNVSLLNSATAAVPDYEDIDVEKPDTYVEPLGSDRSTYVLSKEFYDGNYINCGYFEELIVQYLKKEVLNTDNINRAISDYRYWSKQDQFYLLPILMLLIKTITFNTYTEI